MERASAGRLSRRQVLKGAGAAALAAGSARAGIERAAAANASSLSNVQLPPDLGQTGLQVYLPQTGHTLRGSMLDYWRANGGAAVYGYPISEPYASEDGYYSQAFERAIFQYRWEFQDTEEPIVRLAPVGYRVLEAHGGTVADTGRRLNGGGDRDKRAWRPLAPDGSSATRAVSNGELYDELTGHTVTGSLLDWYQRHEGGFYLGSPLSQPAERRGTVLQYFEGGVLARISDGSVRLQPVVNELADRLGIDTTPVERSGLPDYDESLFFAEATPATEEAMIAAGHAGNTWFQVVGDLDAPGRKWIEVSLGEQRLWAYQGDALVATTLVSTGLAPNDTLTGLTRVRLKIPQQDMQGFTDSSGEVLGFGDAPPGTIPYAVKDVPNVMYFNLEAEAFHGAYWHANFGNPMSHGCINQPLNAAEWMYGWAPLGTMVWVHE